MRSLGLFILVILAVSCQEVQRPEQPEDLIAREKKVEIYTDTRHSDEVSFENSLLKDIDSSMQSGVGLTMIKDGKLGRMLKNPTYTGITPQFWGQLDMLGGEPEWIHWGTPNCGKGQPIQIGHTGHHAVPARFASVRVGVRG